MSAWPLPTPSPTTKESRDTAIHPRCPTRRAATTTLLPMVSHNSTSGSSKRCTVDPPVPPTRAPPVSPSIQPSRRQAAMQPRWHTTVHPHAKMHLNPLLIRRYVPPAPCVDPHKRQSSRKAFLPCLSQALLRIAHELRLRGRSCRSHLWRQPLGVALQVLHRRRKARQAETFSQLLDREAPTTRAILRRKVWGLRLSTPTLRRPTTATRVLLSSWHR